MNKKIIVPSLRKQVFSNRKKKKDDIVFWINSTFNYLIAFISISFIYLIWSLNTWATQWYEIRYLEREKQNLLLQKETLEVKISDIESLDTINKSEVKNRMEETDSPDFIVIRDNVKYAYSR